MTKTIGLIIGLFLGIEADFIYAHKVNLFAYVKGDTIYTESYFSDGRKIEDGKITVFDPKGNILLRGTTDKEGRFNFKLPKITPLRIELSASLGHKDSYILTLEETNPLHKNNPQKEEISLIKLFIGILGIIFIFIGIYLFKLRKRKNYASTPD